jgi:hypothetical protein
MAALMWHFVSFQGGVLVLTAMTAWGRMARPADEAICRRRNGTRRPPVFAGLPLPLGSVEGILHWTGRILGKAHPISQAVLLGGCWAAPGE